MMMCEEGERDCKGESGAKLIAKFVRVTGAVQATRWDDGGWCCLGGGWCWRRGGA